MMETAEQEYQDVMNKKRIVANDKKKIEVCTARNRHDALCDICRIDVPSLV